MIRSRAGKPTPELGSMAERARHLLDSTAGGGYRWPHRLREPETLAHAQHIEEAAMRQREIIACMTLVTLALGCRITEPTPEPRVPTKSIATADSVGPGFRWVSATPESQGMCGSVKVLGCTKTLNYIWNNIRPTQYQTKRLLIIRNDKIIYDRGGTLAYHVYSASKGLLGAPTLVYAMSKCGVGLDDPAANWLSHGDGARWDTDYPWNAVTVEQLASHTSGVCSPSSSNPVCNNGNPGWGVAFSRADAGGTKYVYPKDAFTIARAQAEQNREPALDPGSVFEYTDVGHALLNYVVQRACGQKLTDIFDFHIKEAGMGSPTFVALITTDGGQKFNQSEGAALWKAQDGAAVLRLAGRNGIWDNQNVEPVRFWHALTKTTGNIAAAAAQGWGVVYNNNSTDLWTVGTRHKRLSQEMFGHGGNYSTVFLDDPLTSTIIVREGSNNAKGASYLTTNGCAIGWTGLSPSCTPGTNWSNNWGVSNSQEGSTAVGPRKKILEPLQEAFFFPPPFCRMTAVARQTLDNTTDVYDTPSDATTIELDAEIRVNPREGAGSSVVDNVEFYKESDGGLTEPIGTGTLIAGSSPAQYELSYSADAHGAAGEVRTYFANCIAKSTVDGSKKVPSYSRPVRVRRD
jgi:CubicO group peptidase (beta-lactamase class C family)